MGKAAKRARASRENPAREALEGVDAAGKVGRRTLSMHTSWVAAVPPCMPSTTTASAPALTASMTS